MTEAKRWGIGVIIALLGLMLTAFGLWLQGYRENQAACASLKSEFSENTSELSIIISDYSQRGASIEGLAYQLERVERKIERAGRYFSSQEAENQVAELINTIIDARSAIERDYEPQIFDRPMRHGRGIGEIWNDYLEDADFPPNPTATKTMVRKLLRLGLDQTAGDQLALGLPADPRVIDYVEKKLRELNASLQITRDEAYSPLFQGAMDGKAIIKTLKEESRHLLAKIEMLKERQRESQIERMRIEGNLEYICGIATRTECALPSATVISCQQQSNTAPQAESPRRSLILSRRSKARPMQFRGFWELHK